MSTVSSGSGTRNGSPYISSFGSSMRSPRPCGIGCDAVDHPEPLALAGLAPAQAAGGAHQPLEDLREVAGVEDDQAHALVDALGDAVDDGVVDAVHAPCGPTRAARRSPPAAFRDSPCSGLLQGGGASPRSPFLGTGRRRSAVHAVGIERVHGRVRCSWTFSPQTIVRIRMTPSQSALDGRSLAARSMLVKQGFWLGGARDGCPMAAPGDALDRGGLNFCGIDAIRPDRLAMRPAGWNAALAQLVEHIIRNWRVR